MRYSSRFTFFLSYFALTSAYIWPRPLDDTLEAFLYEGRREDGSSLSSIVHPCKVRTKTKASIAAEWLRTTYHDISTHNVSDGTGGLDGSIVYELDRDENKGVGMTDTLADFVTYLNKYISRADMIAMTTVFAVASCGGPIIPFRGNRKDAFTAGPMGVPQPQHDLESFTANFAKQGFTPTEMITLVACGHTIGGVRNTDFSEIVTEAGSDPDVPNIANFDTTPQYDNVVVQQYLDGTTRNPLVTTPTNMNSDLRIFSSDGNSTMRSLASPDVFADRCATVLEKMLNTVPSDVQLTDEIKLQPAKLSQISLTFEQKKLVFKARLRLSQPVDTTTNKKRTVTLAWCDKTGPAADCKGTMKVAAYSRQHQDENSASPVTIRLNTGFIFYTFLVPIDSSLSISKFWFEIDEHDGSTPSRVDNEGNPFVYPQDTILFVPSLSHAGFPQGNSSESKVKTYTLVAAIRSEVTPSRVYATGTDNALADFPPPFVKTVDLTVDQTIDPASGYTFYSGVIVDSGPALFVDLFCDVGTSGGTGGGQTLTVDFQPTFLLDSAALGLPTSFNTTASTMKSIAGKSTSSAGAGAGGGGGLGWWGRVFWVSWVFVVGMRLSVC